MGPKHQPHILSYAATTDTKSPCGRVGSARQAEKSLGSGQKTTAVGGNAGLPVWVGEPSISLGALPHARASHTPGLETHMGF